jgi:8-oxo-dGTP pyrophosphatase MutT (NUDIX family)
MVSKASPFATQLHRPLQALLSDLADHPYPVLPSPPDVPRRASVCLIIRIRPHYSHPPPFDAFVPDPTAVTRENLSSFFSQRWVRHGDPEILYIKRAANKRDKWTGHVAFPGGRRDETDKNDLEAAVREAKEEVGIDLTPRGSAGAISCGGLSQEVIPGSWGKVPLMTLCPYIFLVTDANSGCSLRLQPGEVASAHWVPMRALMSDKANRYWTQDISGRGFQGQSPLKWVSAVERIVTGSLLFAAVRLRPSESKFTTELREYLPESPATSVKTTNMTIPIAFARARLPLMEDTGATLLLWGLTLGLTGDFLDMLPPHDVVPTWLYPTFTRWDIRLSIWIVSWNFRRQKQKALDAKHALVAAELGESEQGNLWVEANGKKRYVGRIRADARGPRAKSQTELLPDYRPIMHRAVLLALGVRFGVIALLISWFYRRSKRAR